VMRAQEISTGRATTVALIDTGADANHLDLVGNVREGPDLTGLGPGDSSGHGTSMAGLIAGHGHRSGGMLGIAPGATVLSLRVGVKDVGAVAIVRGIDLAIANKVQVICLAEGGSVDSPALRRAIADAEAADIVVVAAAGNTPDDQAVDYPAA